MSVILKVIGREILDSRGYPTVEAEVHVKGGYIGTASVPSGASTGSNEAIELRDNDPLRFLGKGVQKAVNSINGPIEKILLNQSAMNQKYIDNLMIELDGTKNKSLLGANAILAVSLAVSKATAAFKKMSYYEYISEINETYGMFSMPLPMINVINGGKHADNNIDIQEFMIQPIGAKNIKEAIRIGAEIFHCLGSVLKKKGMNTSVGDEGGYAPNLHTNIAALDIISEAVELSGYKLGIDVTFAIDCAASEFFKNQKYILSSEKNKSFTSEEFSNFLENITRQYPIVSIEDALHEGDWSGFKYLTKILGKKIQLVGDDLFVTNPDLIKKGIKEKIANAVLIKLNQIGSLSETLSAIKIAKNAGYTTIISHRSGETEDTTIADLAVGTASGQIKTGSMSRSDRTSKYNQLIRIEEKLGLLAPFNGLSEINCNFKP